MTLPTLERRIAEAKWADRLRWWLLLIGIACMADGLTHIPSNPDAAFAFGLGCALPWMIGTSLALIRAVIAKEAGNG